MPSIRDDIVGADIVTGFLVVSFSVIFVFCLVLFVIEKVKVKSMTEDEAEIIQALIPWVTVQDILATHEWVWKLTDKYLLDDFARLQKSIPQMPLIPFMNGTLPVIRNLRTDSAYVKWERQNGLIYEVLEFEVNRRHLFLPVVSRIEVQA